MNFEKEQLLKHSLHTKYLGNHNSMISNDEAISIYIHWPFCISLCPYCDFNSHLLRKINISEYISSYLKEIEIYYPLIKDKYIKSIFFGGGTPSLMDPKIISAIIDKISFISRVDKSTEVTLEANPTSYEMERFKDFKSSGVNRISIGVQSFNDDNLKFLGRKHSVKEAVKVIESTRNIFENYSFDLIYGLYNQTESSLKHELDLALSLAKNHLSLYQLTIEKGTEFYKLFQKQQLKVIDNDKSPSTLPQPSLT
ncbi:MAG TPA: radical SAM family heme chaperone HemW, partial [Candidatus Megaira endosymbiont of Hartmannula sinica]|nr:radical SAM family heme chaperone HemW [Candidatus Megaera endosymbiont of Hartmannula sinica]